MRALPLYKRYVIVLATPPKGFFSKETIIKLKNMRVTEYIKETRAEMNHVNWPSRSQTIRFTLLVVVLSIATALLLGLADFVFSKLLTLLF